MLIEVDFALKIGMLCQTPTFSPKAPEIVKKAFLQYRNPKQIRNPKFFKNILYFGH